MKYLVIPDIHEKIDKAKFILEKYSEEVDKVIFLGDYFDSFDQPFEKCEETLKFLLDNISNPKYIFLYGNHDLHYIFNNDYLKCSGYKRKKADLIYPYTKELRCKLQFAYQDKSENQDLYYLFTHAGMCNRFLPVYVDENCVARYINDTCKENLLLLNKHPLLMPSYKRGGNQVVGGVTWCDHSEFEPITRYVQLYGHTRGNTVRNYGTNYCLDTDLNHIALVDTEKNTVKIVGVH